MDGMGRALILKRTSTRALTLPTQQRPHPPSRRPPDPATCCACVGRTLDAPQNAAALLLIDEHFAGTHFDVDQHLAAQPVPWHFPGEPPSPRQTFSVWLVQLPVQTST